MAVKQDEAGAPTLHAVELALGRAEVEVAAIVDEIRRTAPLMADVVAWRVDRVRAHHAEVLGEVRALEDESNRVALVDCELMQELDAATTTPEVTA